MEEVFKKLHFVSGNVYQLIFQQTEELTARELRQLNKAGYVYHHSDLDVDFENEDVEGNTVTDIMDIHYFSFTDPKFLHIDQEL